MPSIKPFNRLQLASLSADPGSPVPGDAYRNSTTGFLRVYNGASWDEYGPNNPQISGVALNSWATGTLQNSWIAAGIAGANATPGYRVTPDGFVHLRGQVKNGTGNAAVFTLPVGLRPALDMYIVCQGNTGSADVMARLRIGSSGAVAPTITYPAAGAFISLDNVHFLAEA